jgi:hypothetical protein
MSQADWDAASSAALALFAHGQEEAAKRGLLLVDTKYELGKDSEGRILLDEVRALVRACVCVCVCARVRVCGSLGSVHEHQGTQQRVLQAWGRGVNSARTHGAAWHSEHPPTPLARTHACTHLCPQIHTPDSSRYWLADSYDARHAAGQEPQNIDKEFLRLWFRERCDPYKDKVRAGQRAHCAHVPAGRGDMHVHAPAPSAAPAEAVALP